MAFIRIFDHTTKSTVAVSKCDVSEILPCIDNLANIYGKQFGHTKGSIVRMEVNNLDIIALHQWDNFDDTLGPDDGEEIEQYENFQNMVANEKTFVYSMDTSTFHPHQAFVKFKAGFKNAIKTKQLELPKNITDCFVYILIDDTNAGFKYDMVFNVPDSKFDIGIDKYATKTKYLKNANDLRKLGLSLNSTHRS